MYLKLIALQIHVLWCSADVAWVWNLVTGEDLSLIITYRLASSHRRFGVA